MQYELIGPFELSVNSVDRELGQTISAGVVVFGLVDPQGEWKVQKIDRSDVHIRARLWANIADFSHFSYCLCASPDEAYVLHCELFHKWKPSYGQHPRRPEGTNLQCPVCSSSAKREDTENVA